MPLMISIPSPSNLGGATRYIGSIALDDQVSSFITEVNIPSTRVVQLEQHQGRRGRVSRVQEDNSPLVISITGTFKEWPALGVYYADWHAALMNQSRVPFILGDGTQYQYADVTSLQNTQIVSRGAGTAQPERGLAWTMSVSCYEPFARETAPVLHTLSALTTGAGANATAYSVSYAGTAFAEPTWQFTLVVPGGTTVQRVRLKNTATGEQCTTDLSLGSGTWYVLMDASGGYIPIDGSPPATPNNNSYGLLAIPSVGDGVTVAQLGGGSVDTDFTGNVPTLIPSPSPTLPPSPFVNPLVATITSTGTLTSAGLAYVAPNRYQR